MPGDGLFPSLWTPHKIELLKAWEANFQGQRRPGGRREPGRQGLPAIKVRQPRTLSSWAPGWGRQSQRLATCWAPRPVHHLSVDLSFPILSIRAFLVPAQLSANGRHAANGREGGDSPVDLLPAAPPTSASWCPGQSRGGEGVARMNEHTELPSPQLQPQPCLLLPRGPCKHVSIY